MNIFDNKIFDKAKIILEYLFLVSLSFYVFLNLCNVSSIFLRSDFDYFYLLYWITIVIVVLKLILNFKNVYNIFGLAVLVLSFIQSFINDNYHNVFFGLYFIGSIGIDYKKILKTFFYVALSHLLINTFLNNCGIINSFLRYEEGSIRSFFSYGHPTTICTLILFLVLTFWVTFDNVSSFVILPISALGLFFSYYFCRATCVEFCFIFLFLATIYYIVLKKFLLDKLWYKNFSKVIRYLLIFLFPILFFLMFFFVLQYNEGADFTFKLNEFLNNRIMLGCEAYNTIESFPFGDNELIVKPSSVYVVSGYNYVDCSFLRLYFYNGWIFLIIFALSWMYLTYKAYKKNNYRLIFACSIVLINCFVYPFFDRIWFNPFIILPLSNITSESDETIPDIKNKNSIIRYIILIFSILPFVLLLPYAQAIFQTLATMFNWKDNFEIMWKIYLFIVLCFVLIIIFVYFWTKFVFSFIKNKKIIKKELISLLPIFTILLFFIIVIFKSNSIIVKMGQDKYSIQLRDENDLLNNIINVKSGKFYVDDLPVLYNNKFGNVDYDHLHGEELARYKNNTFLMNKDCDSHIFHYTGYMFCDISDYHILYTNDENVLEFLNKNGYRTKNFSYIEHNVDLKRLASLNKLKMDDNNFICLDGERHSIKGGPHDSFTYGSSFHMHIELELDDKDYYMSDNKNKKTSELTDDDNFNSSKFVINDLSKSDTLICKIYVFGNVREFKQAEIEVYPNNFDDKGNCIIDFDYYMPNYKNVMYVIEVEDNYRLKLKNMKYFRIN